VVAGFQVCGQILRAGLDELSDLRYWQLTASFTGTGAIKQVNDVSAAAEKAVVT